MVEGGGGDPSLDREDGRGKILVSKLISWHDTDRQLSLRASFKWYKNRALKRGSKSYELIEKERQIKIMWEKEKNPMTWWL